MGRTTCKGYYKSYMLIMMCKVVSLFELRPSSKLRNNKTATFLLLDSASTFS